MQGREREGGKQIGKQTEEEKILGGREEGRLGSLTLPYTA